MNPPVSTTKKFTKSILDIDDMIERKLAAKKTSPSPLRKSLPLDNTGFLPLPTQSMSASVSTPILSPSAESSSEVYSFDNAPVPPPRETKPVKPTVNQSESSNKHNELAASSSSASATHVETPAVKEEEVDYVYQRTTSVVKSVIELNTGVQHAKPEEFVDLVKLVGMNLRDLLAAVDNEIRDIPPELHKEVEMAHRVLSSDMAELVQKMKIAQKYADTPLDEENRRNMLQAAHHLALDSKNLYDTYSKLRASVS